MWKKFRHTDELREEIDSIKSSAFPIMFILGLIGGIGLIAGLGQTDDFEAWVCISGGIGVLVIFSLVGLLLEQIFKDFQRKALEQELFEIENNMKRFRNE